jgi:hypothetical protein
LFKQVFERVKNKKHLTQEGLHKIVSIKASLNKGLSSALEAAFPNIIPYSKPEVSGFKIRDPHWIAGFASGEGCFLIRILKSTTSRSGYQIVLVFKLTQHVRDELLMKSLIDYFGRKAGGNYYLDSKRNVGSFIVQKFSDVVDKIIPFFKQRTIIGVKSQDFKDWCQTAELIITKKHLTPEGFDKIKKFKAGMNRGRSQFNEEED